MNRETQKKITVASLIAWICCLIFYLYEFFLRTFVGTVAQNIIADLHLTSEKFAIMGSAYYVTYSLMQMPVAYLTHRFGAKKIIVTAFCLCGLSMWLFSSADYFFVAVIARFFMGLGSSFGFVSLLVVITTWFPPNLYAIFIGISQFIGTLGPLLAGGPLITVLKASGLYWRDLFFRVGLFGILFSFLVLIVFRTKKRNLSSGTVILEQPKSLLYQLKILFTNKQAWLIASFSALSYEAVDFLGAVWGTYYLQARGLSLTLASYTISSAWLGFAIGCPLMTFISDRMRRRKPMLMFCAILGLLATSIITYLQLSLVWLYPVLFFMIGIAASALNLGIVVIIEHVEISIKALALGFNNGLIILFGALIPVSTSFLIHLPSEGKATASNFILGFSILPLMFGLASILATFFIEETFCRPKKGCMTLSNPYKK